MNAFDRARGEARKLRLQLLDGNAASPVHASEFFRLIESELNLAIERVPPSYSELGGGSAVLKRNERAIYVSDAVSDAEFAYLVAHELGHWILDADQQPLTIAYLKELTGGPISPAVVQVEAYGARERQELQANVFAREFLLPRDVAAQLFTQGMGPEKAATTLGVPLDITRLQLLDAVLLPPAVPPPPTVLHAPSPDQVSAAQAPERFANVVAGPGTGKTSTLIHRIKYLVEQKNVDPKNILVLTFTNKAAFELIERLRIAGIDRASDIWAGTFHAFGLEFLRKFHQKFGLPQDVFVADRLSVMTMLVRALPQASLKHFSRLEDPYDWLQPVITGIKRLKEEMVTPATYVERIAQLPPASSELIAKREDVATMYSLHEHELRRAGMVDFVDLVALPAAALREDPKPFSDLVGGFHHVLVDEYQDVTQAMVEMVRQLAAKAQSVWVVGDVRQAIHHWRGASVKSLLKFESTFLSASASGRAGKYSLGVNRRSSEEIVDLTMQAGTLHVLEKSLPLDEVVSSRGKTGIPPSVVTCGLKTDVPKAVIAGIENYRQNGVPFRSQAVLCRKGADLERIAGELGLAGIPVLYIGELARRPEVKRLLCLMQLLAERQPWGLVGLSDDPVFGMTLSDIQALLVATRGDPSYQRGRWIQNVPPGLSAGGVATVGRLAKLLGNATRSTNPWGFVCDMLLERRFHLIDPRDHSIAAQVSKIALWQFAYSVRNGDGDVREARLSRYLLRQRLRQRIGDTYVDRELPSEALTLDAVRLQTVHGSKGLEYEAVHVGYVESGSYGARAPSWVSPDSITDIVPPAVLNSSDAEYEFETAVERNNLLYVATSRAKTYLRLYDDDEFGGNDRAEQLEHYPIAYVEERFSADVQPASQPKRKQHLPLELSVDYTEFDTYVRCGLQYHYRYNLELRADIDLDVSIRARLAAMETLRGIASKAGSAQEIFLSCWEKYKLPEKSADTALWLDAIKAIRSGIEWINRIGGTYREPTTTVAGLDLNLPWALETTDRYGSTFHILRFSSRGSSEAVTLLRPMVSGMPGRGIRGMKLHNLMSEQTADVSPSGAPMKTNAAKAAIRLLAGDVSPKAGRHCGRCSFLTSCPSIPS